MIASVTFSKDAAGTPKRRAREVESTLAPRAATLSSKLAAEDTALTEPERALMQQWLTTLVDTYARVTLGAEHRRQQTAREGELAIIPTVAPRADDLPLVVAWDQLSRPAMRLTEPATITTPNRYDKKAWESTVPRIRGSRMVVSDTW